MPVSPNSTWTRRHWQILGAILLLALVMRAILLNFPRGKFFDEIYYVDAANDYLNCRADSNNVHPPLAKLQLAAAMLLFDVAKLAGLHHLDEPIGWRLLPVLAGVGVVGLSAWLGYILTARPRVALLTAFLVAIEHLSVAESRIVTLDGIQTFWITLGICCAAQRLWVSRRDDWLIFSALSLAVATGCKWNGLFAAAGVVLAGWTIRPKPPLEEEDTVGLAPTEGPVACEEAPKACRPLLPAAWLPGRLKVFLVFTLLIPALYSAAYIPYALAVPEKNVREVVVAVKNQHLRMINFRKDPKQFTHRYISHWFTWPFVYKPVWFHFQSDAGGTCTGIVAFGMIPFWWFSLYLLLEYVAGAWRAQTRDPAGQFLVLTYAFQLVLWASSFTGGFFYYMLTVVPLMAVAVARQLDAWMDRADDYSTARGYLIGLSVMTALYFPFMSGLRVPYKYFQALFFLPNWI